MSLATVLGLPVPVFPLHTSRMPCAWAAPVHEGHVPCLGENQFVCPRGPVPRGAGLDGAGWDCGGHLLGFRSGAILQTRRI